MTKSSPAVGSEGFNFVRNRLPLSQIAALVAYLARYWTSRRPVRRP